MTERHQLGDCGEGVQLVGGLVPQYLLSAEFYRRDGRVG